MLASAGVPPSQYTLVSGGVCMRAPCAASTLPAMLAAKKIDAFGVWEPAVELGIQLVGREKVVVFQNGECMWAFALLTLCLFRGVKN